MIKRTIKIGNYDTAAHGWTLAAWTFSAPEQRTMYVDKTSGDGSWDLSTALTDGVPRYKDRNLSVTLECSEGDRAAREALIREMINTLDGYRFNIYLPDDTDLYISGRVHVARKYSDLAHCSVTVTAQCEPWKYKDTETVIRLTATSTEQVARLTNNGRRTGFPTLTVSGSVTLAAGGSSWSLSAGSYLLPDLVLPPGTTELTYKGTGTVVITYREAVLE